MAMLKDYLDLIKPGVAANGGSLDKLSADYCTQQILYDGKIIVDLADEKWKDNFLPKLREAMK